VRPLLFAAFVLCGVNAACAPASSAPPVADSVVRSKAIACGLGPGHLKFENGIDGKREWLVGPTKDGIAPNFQSVLCFMNWAKDQRSLRVGFISEPPPLEPRK